MSSKEVAEIVMETLEAAGIRYCYGIAGDTFSHVTDAIHRSQIQWAYVCYEGAAAFVAGVEFYISGRLTACAGFCEPGSLHFANGVYEAQRSHALMVLTASQIVTLQSGTKLPREVDSKAVYTSCSVFREQVYDPEQACRVVTLIRRATLNRRGVVVVTLPADISQAAVKDSLPFPVHSPQPTLRPNDVELQGIAHLLAYDKKVSIYVDSGYQGVHSLLVALADRLKASTVHTSRAKDFVEYDNPFNMGMTGMFGIESGFHMITECDTLLLLDINFAWAQFYPRKAILIQVDCNDSHLGHRHLIDLDVVGDVIPTLEALPPLLEVREEHSFLGECLEHREHSLRTLEREEQTGKGELIHLQHPVSLLDQHASEDALFTADGDPATVQLSRHIHSNGKRRTFTNPACGTMANATSQALGLKRVYPERQVTSISSNDGLIMLLGDPLAAIQGKLLIKVVVLNSASLNFVELEQKIEDLLDNYTDLLNPDFARSVGAIGFYGCKVTHSENLEAAAQKFLVRLGPALLDVHINPVESVMSSKIELGQITDTVFYTAKAVLSEYFKDVEILLVDSLLKRIGSGVAHLLRGRVGQARIPGRSIMSARPREHYAWRRLAV